MEYEIYRFVAGRSLVEPEQTPQDTADPNKCLEIIQMADIPPAGASKRTQAKGKGKKDDPKPTKDKVASTPKTAERGKLLIVFLEYCFDVPCCFKFQTSTATRSSAAPAAPVDDPSEYYSAKRRRQPKQPDQPVLVKNSGNSLSALAQMATAVQVDSSEERSAAHWSDVDDSDSDLEEDLTGKKRSGSSSGGVVRVAGEKKPRRSSGGDNSRLVWTEEMVRTVCRAFNIVFWLHLLWLPFFYCSVQ